MFSWIKMRGGGRGICIYRKPVMSMDHLLPMLQHSKDLMPHWQTVEFEGKGKGEEGEVEGDHSNRKTDRWVNGEERKGWEGGREGGDSYQLELWNICWHFTPQDKFERSKSETIKLTTTPSLYRSERPFLSNLKWKYSLQVNPRWTPDRNKISFSKSGWTYRRVCETASK